VNRVARVLGSGNVQNLSHAGHESLQSAALLALASAPPQTPQARSATYPGELSLIP
jgi:hypothetical protein